MSKSLTIVPTLKCGNDQKIAELLVKKFDAADEATKIVFDSGLSLLFVKAQLQHKEFGPWMRAHLPERMWRIKGNSVAASATVSWQMENTKLFIEKFGLTVEKVLAQIPNAWEFEKKFQFFQLEEGSKELKNAPEKIREFHHKGLEAMQGKSAFQLYWEFKQTEEDEGGGRKVKRGQLPGSKGLTKEMREKAAARLEEERLNELEETILERNEWELEIADAKSLGMMENKLLKKFIEARETSVGFARRVLESRKEGGAK